MAATYDQDVATRPSADRVTVVNGQLSLVYLVFNTITNLLTQDGQMACFANAATHLSPGGVFIIEVGVPNLRRLPARERFVPLSTSNVSVRQRPPP